MLHIAGVQYEDVFKSIIWVECMLILELIQLKRHTR